MKRKHFISALFPAAFTLPSKKLWESEVSFLKPHPKIPPYLQVGDTIGITSPAGFISLEDVQPAIRQMQS